MGLRSDGVGEKVDWACLVISPKHYYITPANSSEGERIRWAFFEPFTATHLAHVAEGRMSLRDQPSRTHLSESSPMSAMATFCSGPESRDASAPASPWPLTRFPSLELVQEESRGNLIPRQNLRETLL
jgi:hypothetical protein